MQQLGKKKKEKWRRSYDDVKKESRMVETPRLGRKKERRRERKRSYQSFFFFSLSFALSVHVIHHEMAMFFANF